MSEQNSYPLSWPEGWPRTESFRRTHSPFVRSHGQRRSISEATEGLIHELNLLGATKQVLSTNLKRRLDGLPMSGQAQPNDPGVAVYFELKGKPTSLACDKWNRVEDNTWAICKHIEALRGQKRWGVGSMERQFAGYQALPAVGESGASTWWKVLGVTINSTPDQVRQAYRILVKRHHPDTGGDPELFHRVQRAMESFDQSLRAGENQKAA